MSSAKFASLSPKYQKAIVDAAAETQAWIRKYAADQLQSYLDDLKAKGVDVYTPTPAEYQEWIAVRDSVWKEAAKSYAGKIDLGLAERIYSGKQ
jgi:TRAP-type C4-dicarboxylate transport system substrate-binding protein